jgi:hypothetical protein
MGLVLDWFASIQKLAIWGWALTIVRFDKVSVHLPIIPGGKSE